MPGATATHSRRPARSLTVRRRRAVAAAIAAGVAAALSLPLGLPGGGPLAASGQAAAREGGGRTYVVQAGDTLWGIAQRINPGSDPRPLVQSMTASLGGAGLQVGERIELP